MYTKGKWEIITKDTNDNIIIGISGYNWICLVNNEDKTKNRIGDIDEKEAEVNAKLISRSPELFEACKEVKLLFEALIADGNRDIAVTSLNEKLQSLIQKVEG